MRVPADRVGRQSAALLAAWGMPEPLVAGRPVQVPGDPEYKAQAERRRDGIPVPAMLARQIEGLCRESGAPYLLA